MLNELNNQYWEDRYLQNKTGWDAGDITTPIKEYIDQLTNKNLKILIPGAGNAHEAAYLWQKGFQNVYVLDWAKQPLENLKERIPDFPSNQLLCQDFFTVNEPFDLIIEQTFFCALPPKMRNDYVVKCHELLKNGGKLVGLLFDFPLTAEGPPFGGSKMEYRNLFTHHFEIQVLDRAHNSIQPRAGKELFINLTKK